MQYKINTYPDNILTYLCIPVHFCVLTSGPLQLVPLCVLIVIGPEVKTQNRCRHL